MRVTTRYNVHLYREMKLYFPDIHADSHEAAARIARQQPTDKAHSVDDCDGTDTAALVDVAGDEEYSQSKIIDFPSNPDLLNILKHAVETEEGNWDDGTEEPQWLIDARQAIANIEGSHTEAAA